MSDTHEMLTIYSAKLGGDKIVNYLLAQAVAYWRASALIVIFKSNWNEKKSNRFADIAMDYDVRATKRAIKLGYMEFAEGDPLSDRIRIMYADFRMHANYLEHKAHSNTNPL